MHPKEAHKSDSRPCLAIACGGSGGHLFPGVALAEEFSDFNIRTELFITSKSVDDAGVSTLKDIKIHRLPGKPFSITRIIPFILGLVKSYQESKKLLAQSKPMAMIATGSFACLGPVLAARKAGAKIYLHEANSVPGRAVRLLASKVERVYYYFKGIDKLLPTASCKQIGMPVRRQFEPFDPVACRLQLGLEADRPTMLVMGGSQGARAINHFIFNNIQALQEAIPNLQILHLTGPNDLEQSKKLQRIPNLKIKIISQPFLTEMEFAYGASHLALCRSGASTIAELAAMKVPGVFIPYPYSADGHQEKNARMVEESGAGFMVLQENLNPECVIPLIKKLFFDENARKEIVNNLDAWHQHDATAMLAEDILSQLGLPGKRRSPEFSFIRKKNLAEA